MDMEPVEAIENTNKARDDFGRAYGAEDFMITSEQIDALKSGKAIALDIMWGEYSAFVSTSGPTDAGD